MTGLARLQAELQKRGFYIGKVDGEYGPKTAAALLSFAYASYDIEPDLPKESYTLTGRMSTFGGPKDDGMKKGEPVALVSNSIHRALLHAYFLEDVPGVSPWGGRSLNPDTLYIAMRWNYELTPANHLRRIKVRVTNLKTGASVECQPIDWGPNENTGRIADLSPGAAKLLGLQTDHVCSVEIPFP